MLVIADEAAITDTGRQRQANEDSYVARSPIFAVADGMGGARGGEVASRVATEALDVQIEGNGSAEEELRAVIVGANNAINQLAQEDESRSGMGTTLTVALVGDKQISIAHVGDSRAYLFRDGVLTRLTRDHSLVEELKRQGQLTEAEAEVHPQRSIITRALGPESEVEVDTHSHFARAGDVFLLCSDGLTTMVSEDEIAATLLANADLNETARKLVDLANENGGRDNITVVAFRLDEAKVGMEASGDEEGETLAGASGRTVGEQVREAVDAHAPPAELEQTKVMRSEDLTAAAASSAAVPVKRPRRFRRIAIAAAALFVLVAAGFGAAYGLRQVYFVGTDSQGLVSIYRGLPYELPAGIDLYSNLYKSTVSVDTLKALQRQRLLNHQLRSKRDAADLVRQLEQGKLSR